MAEVTTIGNLTNEATSLAGDEYLVVEQSGVTKKMQSQVLLTDVASRLNESKNLTYYFRGFK